MIFGEGFMPKHIDMHTREPNHTHSNCIPKQETKPAFYKIFFKRSYTNGNKIKISK